jgi:hypothetical protein
MNSGELLAIGTALAGALLSLAAFLPKLLANLKKDNLAGSMAATQQDMVEGMQETFQKELTAQSERLRKLEAKVAHMEETIHSQAIKITRLIVVIIHMRGLLEDYNVPVPPHIQSEIDQLTNPPSSHNDTN